MTKACGRRSTHNHHNPIRLQTEVAAFADFGWGERRRSAVSAKEEKGRGVRVINIYIDLTHARSTTCPNFSTQAHDARLN
jgi:hypothetical protein